MDEVILIGDVAGPRHSSPVLAKDVEAIEVIPVALDPKPHAKWFGGVNKVHLCPPYGTNAAKLLADGQKLVVLQQRVPM
jgi:hypothetical protein